MEASLIIRKRVVSDKLLKAVKNLPAIWYGIALGFALIKARFETETYIDYIFPTYNGYNAPFIGVIIFYSTVMAIFALLLDLLINNRFNIKWTKQKLYVTLLLLIIPFISSLWSIHQLNTLAHSLILLIYLLISLHFAKLRNLKPIFLGLVLTAVLQIPWLLNNNIVTGEWSGLAGNRAITGYMLGFVAVFFITVYRRYSFAALMLFGLAPFTASRASAMAVALTAGVYITKQWTKYKLLYRIPLVIIAVTLLTILINYAPNRTHSLSSAKSLDEFTSNRISIAKTSLSIVVKESPILGFGYHSLVQRTEAFAHNVYLVLYSDLGVFALVVIGSVIWLAFKAPSYFLLYLALISIVESHPILGSWDGILVTTFILAFSINRIKPNDRQRREITISTT